MHVVNRFQKLEHVVLHSVFWEVMTPSLNSVVEIHIHQLKHKCKSTCWLIVEHLIQLNDLRVWTQPS